MKMKRGISLIEILVTVSMIVILLNLSFPALRHYQKEVQLKAVKEDVRTLLIQARNYALNPQISQDSSGNILEIKNYAVCLENGSTLLIKENINTSACTDGQEINGTKKDYSREGINITFQENYGNRLDQYDVQAIVFDVTDPLHFYVYNAGGHLNDGNNTGITIKNATSSVLLKINNKGEITEQ
jgi:type II secretory pathway pseudopilin PulG